MGAELLIAFSMWKSLTSSSFVWVLWGNDMSDDCRGRITIRVCTLVRGVYLDQFDGTSVISVSEARSKGD